MFYTGMVVGLILGLTVGVFVMALLFVSKEHDGEERNSANPSAPPEELPLGASH